MRTAMRFVLPLERMAKLMDWELNGIAETDKQGKMLYDPVELAAELQVETVY
jgi:hypothetical protein